VPRPTVSAGDDFDICYKSSRQFNAQASGTSFLWSPPTGLDDPNSLNPVATLTTSTSYILAVTMQGCTKPSYDTITVTVLPRVNATAGNDTLIFAGLPLQLRASGGIQYQWWPATGLNNAGIAGPIAIFDWNTQDITYIVTVTDQLGCSDTASITVTVDKTGPKILVPTGFTPNDDGRNDVFRPIYVGMKTIDYFRVYNRWGSLIYTHNLNDGKGWDGTINGRKQNTGSFIWMVRATDVLGNVHFKKGTGMLIR
jgi:gliding motility-associated-like protein